MVSDGERWVTWQLDTRYVYKKRCKKVRDHANKYKWSVLALFTFKRITFSSFHPILFRI